ncbi:MAG: hypothetical protein RL130_455, partial [Actinomycetota bacterium]
ELLGVHGSLRMKYGVGQLNSFSRPRDVLSDKFTFMWTRTSTRSPPLYAMTFRIFVRRARVSAHPLGGQTGPLYPQIPSLVCQFPEFVNESKADIRENPLRVERRDFNEPSPKPARRGLIGKSNLLECDLCTSCFESCLCLLCCLLVCLLKKGCWSCIDKILSFL